MPMGKKKALRYTFIFLLGLFLVINLIAILHAWRFTHFTSDKSHKLDPLKMGTLQKMSLLVSGMSQTRPVNSQVPPLPFESFEINQGIKTSCWWMPQEQAKGAFILFHGYSSSKSGMLLKAKFLHELGYSVMLADFMGSGGSEGNRSTIGFEESGQVWSCIEEMKRRGERNIHLLGTSMGAAAILKCLSEHTTGVQSVVLECPFSTLRTTVGARFRIMGLPEFPMADLLTFWGGAINGFNAFAYEPVEYARAVRCPVLLMVGAKDPKVSVAETMSIADNMPGRVTTLVLEHSGHEEYLKSDSATWTQAIKDFLVSPDNGH